MGYFLSVIKNYVTFSGRARRKEYWMYSLFYAIFYILLMILDAILDMVGVLTLIYSLALLLPSLAVGVRRLHDIGRSGWWWLICLIPIVGSIVLLVFFCTDSEQGSNQYGENPKSGLININFA
ncbi:DUF805 domain-containing protein [Celerinatantimonas sp. YJH-8]|uniref:DUF805 domain-containing protein n=1 Tax=Celerinatantimonas sp. YJH-8 TaxID=3228714 RepID=UPI0038C3D7D4